MNYKIITSLEEIEFEMFVNNNLKCGYKLYGNPFVHPMSGWFCQAMIFEGE